MIKATIVVETPKNPSVFAFDNNRFEKTEFFAYLFQNIQTFFNKWDNRYIFQVKLPCLGKFQMIINPYWILKPLKNDLFTRSIHSKPDLSNCLDINSTSVSEDAFKNLKITQEQEQAIRDLLIKIEGKSTWELMLDTKEVKKLEKKIKQVHPLKCIAVICTNAELKQLTSKILKNPTNFKKFVKCIEKHILRISNENEIDKYLKGFSETVGVSFTDVQYHYTNKEWSKLIHILITQSVPVSHKYRNESRSAYHSFLRYPKIQCKRNTRHEANIAFRTNPKPKF